METTLKKFTIWLFLTTAVLVSSTALAETDFGSLVGKWRTEQVQPSGSKITIELEVLKNRTFRGQAYLDGTSVWTYGGNLALEGDKLTWTYVQSSMPLPPNHEDIDIILSVEEMRYTYRSLSTGETNQYMRMD